MIHDCPMCNAGHVSTRAIHLTVLRDGKRAILRVSDYRYEAMVASMLAVVKERRGVLRKFRHKFNRKRKK